jgi:hypothetical protein
MVHQESCRRFHPRSTGLPTIEHPRGNNVPIPGSTDTEPEWMLRDAMAAGAAIVWLRLWTCWWMIGERCPSHPIQLSFGRVDPSNPSRIHRHQASVALVPIHRLRVLQRPLQTGAFLIPVRPLQHRRMLP